MSEREGGGGRASGEGEGDGDCVGEVSRESILVCEACGM